ncbi:hypothetical protein PAV_3c00950 [Paenibacillus alvei DSM 29]|nr:hypothetical protein PAV_3c00950 [Paenibacillus alvei DSM 29]
MPMNNAWETYVKNAKQLGNSFEPFPLVPGNEKAYLGQI